MFCVFANVVLKKLLSFYINNCRTIIVVRAILVKSGLMYML